MSFHDEMYVRLAARLEAALADNAAKDAAVMGYLEHHGAEHDDGCPEDDTCECPLVVALNKAFIPGAGAALLRRLKALQCVRDRLRDDVSSGCIKLVDECRALHDACAEADKEGA